MQLSTGASGFHLGLTGSAQHPHLPEGLRGPPSAGGPDGSSLSSVRIYRSHSNVADALRAGDMLVVSPLAGTAAAAVGEGLHPPPTAADLNTSGRAMVPPHPRPAQPPTTSAAAASGEGDSEYSLLGLPSSGSLLPEAPPLQLHPHPSHSRVLDCSMLAIGASPLAPAAVGGHPGTHGYMQHPLQAGGGGAQPPHLRWTSPCIVTPTSSGSLDSLDTPTLSPALGRSYSGYLRDRAPVGHPGPAWPPGHTTTAATAYPGQHHHQQQQQQHSTGAAVAAGGGVPRGAAGAGSSGLMAALMRRRQRLDRLHQQQQQQHQQQKGANSRGGAPSQELQAPAATGGSSGGPESTFEPTIAAAVQRSIAGIPLVPAPDNSNPRSTPSAAAGRPTRRAAAAAVAAWNTALVTGDDWSDGSDDAAASSDGSESGESEFSSDTDSDSSDMEDGAPGATGVHPHPVRPHARAGVSRFAGALGMLITSPPMGPGSTPGAAATAADGSEGAGGAAAVSIAPRRRVASRRAAAAMEDVTAAAAPVPAAAATSPAASGRAGTKRRQTNTNSSSGRSSRTKQKRSTDAPAAPATGSVRRTGTACSSNTAAVVLAAAAGGGSPTASSARPAAAAGGAAAGAAVPAVPEGGSTSSQYRGVTRHRRSGRWEAHLWIKELGRQVYLGGYEDEAAAAQAYDLAVLRSKGAAAVTNFPPERYRATLAQLAGASIEEMIMAVRRQSQGFSRGTSSHRGVTAHPSGRWEARIGIPGSRHVYLGLYEGEGEAARAYDASLVRLRGLTAATNFNLAGYTQQLAEHYQLQEVLNGSTPEEVGHVLTPHGEQGPEFEAWIKTGAPGVGLVVGAAALERAVDELGGKE